jgi:phosphatidylethanolamine/phosphatidyl-N-methylethanolamine N-methyltransferase
MEKSISPFSGMLGFRPNLELASLPDLPGFRQVDIRSANLFGFWKMVHYRGQGAKAA